MVTESRGRAKGVKVLWEAYGERASRFPPVEGFGWGFLKAIGVSLGEDPENRVCILIE